MIDWWTLTTKTIFVSTGLVLKDCTIECQQFGDRTFHPKSPGQGDHKIELQFIATCPMVKKTIWLFVSWFQFSMIHMVEHFSEISRPTKIESVHWSIQHIKTDLHRFVMCTIHIAASNFWCRFEEFRFPNRNGWTFLRRSPSQGSRKSREPITRKSR